MTNFEHYKKEILSKASHDVCDILTVTNNGHIAWCTNVPSCSQCALRSKDTKDKACALFFLEWLYEPYCATLTGDEMKFCELMKGGYIARDADGLFWYSEKPRKSEYSDTWNPTDGCRVLGLDLFDDVTDCKFEFIRVEDKEPWEIVRVVSATTGKETFELKNGR